jgi:hypothetical protein
MDKTETLATLVKRHRKKTNKTKMDKTETLATLVKRHRKKTNKTKMDKTETLATLVKRHRKKSNKTKNLRDNQEWIRERHWQHWSQDTGRRQTK